MRSREANAVWAGALLDEMARAGVETVCVAPGSRSTPLVLAAASDDRFRVVSILDERSAGFFGLGVGRATGAPAIVITTSGTAGANLYPAVVEASQGEVPLLLLTADRPHRLRDSDGNQAIDQLRLFGVFPRAFLEIAPPVLGDAELKHLRGQACRAVALAKGPPAGPVHLNLPFEKPLEPRLDATAVPLMGRGGLGTDRAPTSEALSDLALRGRGDGIPFVRVSGSTLQVSRDVRSRLLNGMSGSSRGVIIAGPVPDAGAVGPGVVALAAATGFPLLADPLSGARFGPSHGAQVVAAYDLFLRSDTLRRTLKPDFILRVGASPTSASVLAYLRDYDRVPQVVVDDGHRWKDHTVSAHEYLRASPGELLEEISLEATRSGDPEWRALWEDAQRRTLEILDDASRDGPMEGWILRDVADVLPEGGSLVISSSMPVRDLDAFGLPRQAPLNVYGNRGASGIDGVVSTTVGIASVSDGPTVGVVGDLAFLHDLNGLLALKQGHFPVGFVVVNNDGGGIFHTLPVRAFEPAFTRFFVTPQGLDLEMATRLHGIAFQRLEHPAGFRDALRDLLGSGERFILEVICPREAGHARRRQVLEAVEAEMEGLAGTRGVRTDG